MDSIKSKIRSIPNFPKQGVIYRDITTLISDADGLREVIDELTKRYTNEKIDYVVGIESRGFIFGGALAHKLGVGFIPIRKKGKLPREVIREEYTLEYGTDIIEIHKDALKKGDRIVIIDDLLATAGTMLAAIKLVEKAGGQVVSTTCVIELTSLGGREKIKDYKFVSLVQFEGE